MKPAPPAQPCEEIELKLALPGSDPSGLGRRLARTPILARRKATYLQLHNVYYDTPEQDLRRQRVALRIRRVGGEAQPQWLQTLKTGGRGDSALSQRGEWEAPVPDAALSATALEATPWSAIDPHGTVWAALAPCFATTFERTRWLVRRRDGSEVEVALDIGHIVAGDKRAPICELELELVAGSPAALFTVAQQIARTLAVLPVTTSKAERGYALAQDTLDQPLRAQPPKLSSRLTLRETMRRVLGEMFCQFTGNLDALRNSDDPEVVHQARVGWRRFKSAVRLFKPALGTNTPPPWQSMQALLSILGDLRDLDVACTETLPPLGDVYAGGDARRAAAWQAMTQAVAQATALQRKAMQYALQEPAVGVTLLAATQWLDGLSTSAADALPEKNVSLRRWARRRMMRLHEQLQRARQQTDSPEQLHRVRILAKRVRYGVEALRTLLPAKRTQRWYEQAVRLQTGIGATRDIMQACALVASLETDRGVVEFLRGVAVGREKQQ